jgi:hypothetical protein
MTMDNHQSSQQQEQPQQTSSSSSPPSSPSPTMQQQQQQQQERLPNAYTSASFLSKLFFTWPYPLLQHGMKHTLNDSDLPENTKKDTSYDSLQHFHTIWNQEQKKSVS